MALTKTEAAKLTQDLMVRGVIDTIVKDSQLFQMLPFLDVIGTAVVYNREATNPAAAFYDVGDTWTTGWFLRSFIWPRVLALERVVAVDANRLARSCRHRAWKAGTARSGA